MGHDYWNHIEPFWDSINIYDGVEEFLQGFMETPEHAAHLFALHWCASEVCNGGFHQFFFNSTGVLAPEAVAGLKAIGMPQTANVVAEAMASFGEPFPRDREERQDALDALTLQCGTEGQWQSPARFTILMPASTTFSAARTVAWKRQQKRTPRDFQCPTARSTGRLC